MFELKERNEDNSDDFHIENPINCSSSTSSKNIVYDKENLLTDEEISEEYNKFSSSLDIMNSCHEINKHNQYQKSFVQYEAYKMMLQYLSLKEVNEFLYTLYNKKQNCLITTCSISSASSSASICCLKDYEFDQEINKDNNINDNNITRKEKQLLKFYFTSFQLTLYCLQEEIPKCLSLKLANDLSSFDLVDHHRIYYLHLVKISTKFSSLTTTNDLTLHKNLFYHFLSIFILVLQILTVWSAIGSIYHTTEIKIKNSREIWLIRIIANIFIPIKCASSLSLKVINRVSMANSFTSSLLYILRLPFELLMSLLFRTNDRCNSAIILLEIFLSFLVCCSCSYISLISRRSIDVLTNFAGIMIIFELDDLVSTLFTTKYNLLIIKPKGKDIIIKVFTLLMAITVGIVLISLSDSEKLLRNFYFN